MSSDGSLVQPPYVDGPVVGQTPGQQYRSCDSWPTFQVPQNVLALSATAGLWVPGSYACVWDVFDISIPEDQANDFTASTIQRWLLVGAAKINEHLGNRGWHVPLVWWSESVVWANTELCYLGAYRKRGRNTEADYADFLKREADVNKWLTDARDRQITPDFRLSDSTLSTQAFRYIGNQNRMWDQPPGYLRHGLKTRRF